MEHLDADAVAAYVDGRLSASQRADAERHIDGCASCRSELSALAMAASQTAVASAHTVPQLGDSVDQAATAPAADVTPSIVRRGSAKPRGAMIGRYVLLNVLGEGGMGVVYAAYDPDLGRKVALKMMKADVDSEELRARQLREAQAMARLNHPNVISIYDYGSQDGSVFIVMELVEGSTLSEWLTATTRSRQEILSRFAAAGHGLAAAHSAGLIHRDFKPQNVLIGNDGRVRVTDFGLVRVEGLAEPSGPPRDTVRPSDPALERNLTAHGTVMGSPAYMAPEQHTGEPTTAKTDQFGFCVALWEALYGRLPFAATTAAGLAIATAAGKIAEPPESARVPAWTRRILTRGLSADPGQRYPSMGSLLAALAADPVRRIRRIVVAAGIIALVGAAVVGYGAYEARAAREETASAMACTGQDRALAGVWDADHRAAIHAAFTKTKKPFAEQAWNTVSAQLDAYTAQWTAARVKTCEETRVRGTQSEQLLDLRMGCFDRRLTSVAALVDVFAHADATVLEHAVSATASLDALDTCSTAVLDRDDHTAWDATQRKAIDEGWNRSSRAHALLNAGKYSAAKTEFTAIVATARKLDYAPLLAEALRDLGSSQEKTDSAAAQRSFVEAAAAADRSRNDGLRANVLAKLADSVSGQGLYEERERWGIAAEAALARAGTSRRLACIVENNLAGMYVRATTARGLELAERALEDCRGNDASTLVALGDLGGIHEQLGHTAKAKTYYEQALVLGERLEGPDHPDLAVIHSNLGDHYLIELDGPQARAHFERAREILVKNNGNDFNVLMSLAALGELTRDGDQMVEYARRARDVASKRYGANTLPVYLMMAIEAAGLGARGDYAEAVTTARKALAGLEPTRDPESIAYALAILGQALCESGQPAEGWAVLERASKTSTAGHSEDHRQLAEVLTLRGRAELELGRAADAERSFTRAVELLDLPGDPRPRVIPALIGRGEARLALGRAADAIEPLERASTLATGRTLSAIDRGRLAFALARARWETGDRAHAREPAQQARAAFAEVPAKIKLRERGELTAWLAAHGMQT